MMLSPVREDTPNLHINRLRWMRYLFIFFLVVNLFCVVYAVTRSARQQETQKHAVTEVDSGNQSQEPQAELESQGHHESQEAEEDVVTTTDEYPTITIVEPILKGIESVGRDMGSSRVVEAPHRWMYGWHNRITSWQAEDNARQGELRDRESSEPIEATARNPKSAQTLTIRNMASNGGAVAFLANGQMISLKTGEAKEFGIDQPQRIQFHRGGKFGNASFTLNKGTYQFEVTPEGWALKEYRD